MGSILGGNMRNKMMMEHLKELERAEHDAWFKRWANCRTFDFIYLVMLSAILIINIFQLKGI